MQWRPDLPHETVLQTTPKISKVSGTDHQGETLTLNSTGGQKFVFTVENSLETPPKGYQGFRGSFRREYKDKTLGKTVFLGNFYYPENGKGGPGVLQFIEDPPAGQ